MRSGVETPDGNEFVLGESRLFEDVECVDVLDVVWAIVVLRCMFVVSELGGGGRFIGKRDEEAVIILARHRKHSPVP
jgi:hypothetical protein